MGTYCGTTSDGEYDVIVDRKDVFRCDDEKQHMIKTCEFCMACGKAPLLVVTGSGKIVTSLNEKNIKTILEMIEILVNKQVICAS